MKTFRGKLYWSPAQVRVWMNGCFFDLGEQSLESSHIVADEFDLDLVLQKEFPHRAVVRQHCVRAGRNSLPATGMFSR
jgi:hypothetical protein